MNWLKVTAAQNAALASLNATAPTNFHISPVADANGVFWISGALRSAPEYAHFAGWLAQTFEAQVMEPAWPVSQL